MVTDWYVVRKYRYALWNRTPLVVHQLRLQLFTFCISTSISIFLKICAAQCVNDSSSHFTQPKAKAKPEAQIHRHNTQCKGQGLTPARPRTQILALRPRSRSRPRTLHHWLFGSCWTLEHSRHALRNYFWPSDWSTRLSDGHVVSSHVIVVFSDELIFADFSFS